MILLVGPPASGKTTYCNEKLSSYFRISQDDMGRHEHLDEFLKAVRKKHYIVVDRVNSDKAQRGVYLEAAKHEGFKTKIIIFECDYKTCVERALIRKGHPTLKVGRKGQEDFEAKVGFAINGFFHNFQRPTPDEVDEIQVVMSGNVVVRNSNKEEQMEDQEIKCVDCGKGFAFTVGDQEFFAEKGFDPPKRCRECKAIKKAQNPQQSTPRSSAKPFVKPREGASPVAPLVTPRSLVSEPRDPENFGNRADYKSTQGWDGRADRNSNTTFEPLSMHQNNKPMRRPRYKDKHGDR